MKITFAAAVLLGLFALVVTNPLAEHEHHHHQHNKGVEKVDKEQFLLRQKDILRLFQFINQPSYYKDFIEIARVYRVENNIKYYTKPEVVEYFLKLYGEGFLKRGQIFSIFNDEHLKQAKALFRLFFYTDYDTFFKTAVWARQNLNEGLFLYCLSVALVHRPDTYEIILPPIYEVYPYYFYNSDVLQKVYNYKERYDESTAETKLIYANYSGSYLNLNPEQSLSYYLEDVGINSYYYYYNIYYPFWLSGDEVKFNKQKRGEIFYFVHQQLLARYYLERRSNGYGDIEFFNWELPFKTGYYPSMRYPNGLEFPSRPNFANLKEYFYNYGQKWCWNGKYGYSYTYIQDYERRIRDLLDRGYTYSEEGKRVELFTPEGFNTFANILESNADSPNRRFYGALHIFARHLLGYSYQPKDKYRLAPSALEHFETSLRDPAFYQLYKRFVLLFQKYKSYLPSYFEKDLYYRDVTVEKVEFDPLMTYYDYFDADVSQAALLRKKEFENDSFKINVRQYRLNHKPFNYRISAKAEKDSKVSIRVFIGPKYDRYGNEYSLNENRINFVQFDAFAYDLKAGMNLIERKSGDSFIYHPDRTTYRELYKKVLGALDKKEEFHMGYESTFGFPARYRLPKGSYDGETFQYYVLISPYKSGEEEGCHKGMKTHMPMSWRELPCDGYPIGYPFDRHIEYENFFKRAPNSYFYDAKVYFRNSEELHEHH